MSSGNPQEGWKQGNDKIFDNSAKRSLGCCDLTVLRMAGRVQRRKQDEGKQWAMVCCADSYQESEGLETRTDPKSNQYHWR